MKKILLFLFIAYFSLSSYCQKTDFKYHIDSVLISSKVEFFIYDGLYDTEENIKEPSIKFILTIKNLGVKPIPNLGVSNRSQYVNLYINDSINNPISLYNGKESSGNHLLNKGAKDTYTWWVFENSAYSNTFTVQWKYLDLFSEKFKINVSQKTIKLVK